MRCLSDNPADSEPLTAPSPGEESEVAIACGILGQVWLHLGQMRFSPLEIVDLSTQPLHTEWPQGIQTGLTMNPPQLLQLTMVVYDGALLAAVEADEDEDNSSLSSRATLSWLLIAERRTLDCWLQLDMFSALFINRATLDFQLAQVTLTLQLLRLGFGRL